MMVFVKIETIAETPCCAFFNTVNDRFEENALGTHDFGSPEEVAEHPEGERLARLVPAGFWDRK